MYRILHFQKVAGWGRVQGIDSTKTKNTSCTTTAWGIGCLRHDDRSSQ